MFTVEVRIKPKDPGIQPTYYDVHRMALGSLIRYCRRFGPDNPNYFSSMSIEELMNLHGEGTVEYFIAQELMKRGE